MIRYSICLALAGALLASCSGGGGAVPGATVPGAGLSTTAPRATGSATFSIKVPARNASGASRKPAYVSAATASMRIDSGGLPLALLNVSAASPGCAVQSSGAVVCTVQANPPAGDDVFTFTAFDQPNAAGAVLSRANVAAKIVAGTTNTVPVTLNGVVASVTLSTSPATLNAGTAASATVIVSAKDADGNVIIGPGSYDQAISVTSDDPSGTIVLTAANPGGASGPSASVRVTDPSTVVTLAYNGGNLNGTNITATAPGAAAAGPVFFSLQPVVAVEYTIASNPDRLAADANGNVWYTSALGNVIGRVAPSGARVEFPHTQPLDIARGADGNMWVVDGTSMLTRFAADGTQTPFHVGCACSIRYVAGGADGKLYVAAPGYDTASILSYDPTPFADDPTSYIDFRHDEVIGMSAASSGDVYFITSSNGATPNALGRISLSRNNTTVSYIPQAGLIGSVSAAATAVWLTAAGNFVRYVPQTDAMTTFSAPPGITITGLTVGRDLSAWFSDYTNARVGRVSPGGTIFETAVPSRSDTFAMTTAADGSIWFAEVAGIGKIAY